METMVGRSAGVDYAICKQRFMQIGRQMFSLWNRSGGGKKNHLKLNFVRASYLREGFLHSCGCLVSAPRFLTFQIPLIHGINQGKRARKRDGSHFWNVRMDCGLLGVDSILTMRLHNQIRYPRASRVCIKFSSITFPQRLLLFPSPLVFHAAWFVAVKSEKKYDKFMVIRRYLESVIA